MNSDHLSQNHAKATKAPTCSSLFRRNFHTLVAFTRFWRDTNARQVTR